MNMSKKSLVMILVLGMFCFGFVSASNLLTKIDFEISGFSGISSLNNSDGESVVISIFNDSGVVVSRNAVAGVYLPNMTITMSGAKFNLSYSTKYTYNLSTIYGNFLYNFTTPGAGAAALTWSADHPDGYVDWATAESYCSVTLGNGYRLPYMWELAKYFQQNGQGSFQADFYWSSTEDPGSPGYAYNVHMDLGLVFSNGKADPNGLARCAR